MRTFDSEEQLALAVATVADREPRFRRVLKRHGLPPLRRMEPGLKSLLRIVTEQLISLKASDAIWARVEHRIAPFTVEKLVEETEASLMALGLSGAKARTFLGLANAAMDGRLDFQALNAMPDELALENLISYRGIGRWTADIYLLSALGRPDAWPSCDLALQVAAKDLLGLEKRPDQRQMESLAEAWRPWRSAAARLLWSHYRSLRNMSQTD